MQKVYVSEEEKEKFMEKLTRDVEVSELLLHRSATGRRHHTCPVTLKGGLRRLLKPGRNAGKHAFVSAPAFLMLYIYATIFCSSEFCYQTK